MTAVETHGAVDYLATMVTDGATSRSVSFSHPFDGWPRNRFERGVGMDSGTHNNASDCCNKEVCERIAQKHDGDEIVYTACSQNGCFDLCLLRVHKRDGKIVAIETDNSIHENHGREDEYVDEIEFKKGMYQHRACVRGRGWRKDVHSDDRILYPMRRVGPKGPGATFERISWDEALDEIAEKYTETREKFGGNSIYCDAFLGMSFDPFGSYYPDGGLSA